MPVYEYYCKTCDKVYEFIQKISDEHRTRCEVCNGPLTKQISLSSFHLKGSGWYATDYGKRNGNGTGKHVEKEDNTTEKTTEKTEKPSKSENAEKSSTKETKKESKTASKPE